MALESQVKKLKRILEIQRKNIKCLKLSSDQDSKIWERKYLILRNSLHALKDEMFTRQSFIRQFITLSDTSFNYHKAKPLYIEAKGKNQPQKGKKIKPTILPPLRSKSSSSGREVVDVVLSLPPISKGTKMLKKAI
ncbi:uncharacterized protein C10orf67, mitochondrial-like [Gracilinanus agilis]|uniref:uncharacterized protein C10orf67, mitochondrial-like n=1 Tax=Gracilinanus agilis TaxID=191870 RepID=UPI001CFED8AE|nr:uncharacterized protein C10orf67, mitochondrial-like [Gracilinanus agilis]